MKKKVFLLIFIGFFICILEACSTNSESTFSIMYIDVGQGDAALVECDGHYMLIDGGDVTTGGDKVYSILEERKIQKLDILVMSHLHNDHIGGLEKVLTYASKIDLTISNADYDKEENDVFEKVNHQLKINGSKITIPHEGEKFDLGSAVVEVVDVSATDNNDSLVLLITYGKTKFLFTGDIEYKAQKRISDKYQNDKDEPYKIDVMKMPHHGSKGGDLIRFVRTFMPKYAVISCGLGNRYGHPDKETLELLDQADVKIYRTDFDGDITVKSDGKNLSFVTSK